MLITNTLYGQKIKKNTMPNELDNIYKSELAFRILAQCTEEATPQKIAEKINQSEDTVLEYLKKLLKHKLIKYKGNGKGFYVVNKDTLTKKWNELNIKDRDKFKEIIKGKIRDEENPELLLKMKKELKDCEKSKTLINKLAKNDIFKDFLVEFLRTYHMEEVCIYYFLTYSFHDILLSAEYIVKESIQNKKILTLLNKLITLKKISEFKLNDHGIALELTLHALEEKLKRDNS